MINAQGVMDLEPHAPTLSSASKHADLGQTQDDWDAEDSTDAEENEDQASTLGGSSMFNDLPISFQSNRCGLCKVCE